MTLVAGVDIGSTTAKVVLLQDGKIVAHAVSPTGANCNAAAETSLQQALGQIGKTKEDVEYIVSTGYGRRSIDFGNESITEITANAKGAIFLGSNAGTIKSIIDIGGQDTKAIVLNDQGQITNFVMNDKCAAGTGRFIDVIARALDEELDNFVALSMESTAPVRINSTCTVFAESEVISLIANRTPKKDIIAGIHKSIAKRVIDMGRNAGIKPTVFFDGGGAKNQGLRLAMEKEFGSKLYVPEHPQIVVALGAAVIAHDKLKK